MEVCGQGAGAYVSLPNTITKRGSAWRAPGLTVCCSGLYSAWRRLGALMSAIVGREGYSALGNDPEGIHPCLERDDAGRSMVL